MGISGEVALAVAKKYTDSVSIAQGNIPSGGTTGQILKKKSNTDYDTEWGLDDSSGRYNVLDYGLVTSSMSDKTADNSSALATLISTVPNGSVIFFPVGIYNFASGITINKDVTFIGENEEMQTAGNTFDATHNRPHDPMSILRYTGSTAGTTMFTRASDSYTDINFVNLTFDGGNFVVKENTAERQSGVLKYEYLIEEEGVANINGLDLSKHSPTIVKNCMFWGFSGFAIRDAMHHYIENCGFFWCKKGIVTTFTDSMLHNLWFCKCRTAIFMSNVVAAQGEEQRAGVSVNVSDIWADQLTGHFIEADGGSQYGGDVTSTSSQIIASNLWIDHVQMSAFYLPTAFMSDSRISGTFGRIGMNYAGLDDADRTAAIAVESDFFYTGQYIATSNFELNISNVEGKGQNTGECFSRLFTTRSNSISNKNNKITCNKFPVARLLDANTSAKGWDFLNYHGTDGSIDRAGSLDYTNGVHFHNNSPSTSTWAPYVGARYYNYLKHILYRCTAINIVNNAYVFTWEEVQRGTQFETMPSPSLNLVGLVVQYVGETTSAYTHGYFYECINDGSTRKWVRVNIQPTELPLLPSTDGTYKLQVVISSGIPTYSWVADT